MLNPTVQFLQPNFQYSNGDKIYVMKILTLIKRSSFKITLAGDNKF